MKNRKNLLVHLVSLLILCVGYVLTRYIFFGIHGMKQWPLVLFICGVVVIVISFICQANLVPVFTAVTYIIGFIAGVIFQTDGIDAGGGKTNNLWIIWTVVFACSVISASINELIAAWKKQSSTT
ncbi:hypothetical protein ABXS75_18670 [Roseburia hominis]